MRYLMRAMLLFAAISVGGALLGSVAAAQPVFDLKKSEKPINPVEDPESFLGSKLMHSTDDRLCKAFLNKDLLRTTVQTVELQHIIFKRPSKHVMNDGYAFEYSGLLPHTAIAKVGLGTIRYDPTQWIDVLDGSLKEYEDGSVFEKSGSQLFSLHLASNEGLFRALPKDPRYSQFKYSFYFGYIAPFRYEGQLYLVARSVKSNKWYHPEPRERATARKKDADHVDSVVFQIVGGASRYNMESMATYKIDCLFHAKS